MNFTELNYAQKEYDFMSILRNHPNIQSCDDYYESSDHIIQVQPLMQTDMLNYLLMIKRDLTESEVREIFHSMVKAVAHCHENNIIHRDIKLDNFLVGFDSNGNMQIKLTDFGLSCNYDSS